MPAQDTPLYPLIFEPIYKEKVWGGRNLNVVGKALPGEGRDDAPPIGESWELADLSQTSVSGGGGGSERSVIANGPLSGQTLHDVMDARGSKLLGNLKPNDDGDFPILIKFLDANEHLSVQVHPSPAYAAAHDDAFLKSEAWYIIDAKPDAVIYKGVKEGVTREQFGKAIADDTVEDLMIAVPVKAGDCHYLPSGTCHALGAGIVVAEVQTPSDTTFRVYDWGRTGRELHIEQALECIEYGPAQTAEYEKRSHIAGTFTTVTRLVTCEHFRIEKIRMSEGYEQEIPYDQPAVWMVLEGGGQITPGNGADVVEFQRGQTLLVPANMNDARIKLTEDTVWLEVTFPQAMPETLA
jgi:mannose-6-phosphate isomerase